MELVYYKAEKGNFGDDLNPFIFNKLLGDFNNYKAVDFVGIGSIVDTRLNQGNFNVVFGSGVRDVNFKYNKSQFDIRFVRGPLSSKILDNSKYITDAAYALGLIDLKKEPKVYKTSYMPYYGLVDFYDWDLLSRITGINIIYPTDNLDKVLLEISKSERLLTSAMHGAIIADLFRVPWRRCQIPHGYESSFFTEFKWLDWTSSMNIENLEYTKTVLNIIPRKTFLNKCLRTIQFSEMLFKFKKDVKYSLSNNEVHLEKLELLNEEVEMFKKDYLL